MSDRPPVPRWAWGVVAALMAAVHVGVPLVRPLHIDTLYTGGKMLLSWGELWEDLQVNAYPPLYFIALKPYTLVAGVSPFALLLPSAIACVLVAPALAWAIRPWVADPRLRLLAAALAVLHPYLVLNGSGLAKPYALMWLCMVIGTGFYARGRMRAFAVCCVVAAQLQFQGLALPVVCAAHALLVRRHRAATAAALGLAVLLDLVWAARIATRVVDGTGLGWIADVDTHTLVRHLLADWQWLWLGTLRPATLWTSTFEQGCAVALLAIMLGLVIRFPGRSSGRLFLRLALLMPFVGLAVLDRFRPLYYLRYVGFLVFPAAVLVALGTARLKRGFAVAALVLLVAGRIHGFVTLGTEPVPRDYRTILNQVRALPVAERALVVMAGGSRWHHTWRSYVNRLDGPWSWEPRIVHLPGFHAPDVAALAEAVAGEDEFVLTGYAFPRRVTLPGWECVDVFGEWRHFNEWNGSVVRYPLHALYRRR